ncbi:hypothetical protein [Syntrophobotulus glycolicus]|uniref:hypothetical protein n=1 Tax=Syntrophobotulus glycolicus TaxID=51197 RepID=UPI0011D165AF|nr:hypothetical protein [Syntrophobotulus glycolicus]
MPGELSAPLAKLDSPAKEIVLYQNKTLQKAPVGTDSPGVFYLILKSLPVSKLVKRLQAAAPSPSCILRYLEIE